jgi:hypothetical protein
MDSIDITDATFSLDVPDLNQVISTSGGGVSNEYTMYIYVGIGILVVIIGMFIFHKFNQNKKQNQNSEDCPGGFCTMNEAPRQI